MNKYCSVCGQTHEGSACPMHYDQDMPIYNDAMSVIDTLNAAMKEQEEINNHNESVLTETIAQLETQIDELKAENRALRKDMQRREDYIDSCFV